MVAGERPILLRRLFPVPSSSSSFSRSSSSGSMGQSIWISSGGSSHDLPSDRNCCKCVGIGSEDMREYLFLFKAERIVSLHFSLSDETVESKVELYYTSL